LCASSDLGWRGRTEERLVDASTIAIVSGAIATLGLTVRRLFVYLERRDDRKLAQHVFDETGSTRELGGYTKLRRALRPFSGMDKSEHEIEEPPQISDEDDLAATAYSLFIPRSA